MGDVHDDEDDERPRVGEPLPGADRARIDPAKLLRYVLDPDSPVGRNKAIVFERALGIGKDDWEYLRDSILAELPRQAVYLERPPKRADERTTWGVLVPIRGLGHQVGRELLVTTAWEIVDDRPELKTALVASQRMQRETKGN